jgi:hypothetical protein
VTDFLQDLFIALVASGALVTLVLGAFGWFWRRGYTLAESGAYAIVSTLMALSCIFQLTFFVGYPQFSFLIETLWLIWVLKRASRLKHLLEIIGISLRKTFHSSPMILGIIALVWFYTGLQAFLLPPENWYWQQIVPVLWLERIGSFWGSENTCNMLSVLTPINHSILAHFYLRFHSDLGIGLFNFLAYIAIGLTTYALARRYAWPPTAFTVAVVVLCLPRFVYLSTTPSIELIGAAVCAFCLLAIYRSVEQPNAVDFLFVVWGILFVISAQPLSPAFAVLLLALAVVLLLRRHGMTTWQSLIAQHRWLMLSAILPAIVFSQGWLFIYNLLERGAFSQFRLMAAFPQNPDVIKGALANFLRYGIESLHLTQMVEVATTRSVGASLVGLGQQFYDTLVTPVLGSSGALQTFKLVWLPNDMLSWFGPWGAFLIFPSLVYALIRGQRRLKATALVLIGYLYMVVLIVAWKPGNASYFSSLFGCSAFLAAFLLPPWRISNAGKIRLQGVCVLLLIYACLCNTAKPATGYEQQWLGVSTEIGNGRLNIAESSGEMFARSIWTQARWGQNRMLWAQKVFRDSRIDSLHELLPAGATVWISARDQGLFYPLLLYRPDLQFYLYPDAQTDGGHINKNYDNNDEVYLLALDHEFSAPPTAVGGQLIWSAPADSSVFPGELKRINGFSAVH